MTTRPRLTPAIADVRRAVREALASLSGGLGAGVIGPDAGLGAGVSRPGARGVGTRSVDSASSAVLVLVALSGGADSLALAAATAFEAPRAGLRAGAVIVDHGLQAGSADVAARAAAQARELGLEPVLVKRVEVGTEGGPEAAARDARYAALAEAAVETGASAILFGHTLDDQAETVLLGLARGSGGASLSGMAPVIQGFSRPDATIASARTDADEPPARPAAGVPPARPGASVPPARPGASDPLAHPGASDPPRGDRADPAGASVTYVRPLLGIRRAQTLQFCADSGLEPWHDPHNVDPAFARVRVRETVLPLLEVELGPGIAEALARTAELSREDSEALDLFAEEQVEELADHAEAGLSLSVAGLANNPAALRQRIIRLAVASEFGVSLSRAHTLEVARLVTGWHGQGELHLPGIRVVRQGGLIVFSAAEGGERARG